MRKIISRTFIVSAITGAMSIAPVIGIQNHINAASPKSTASSSVNATTNAKTPAKAFIIIKQKGKPDRKCMVISSHLRPNGDTELHVRAIDNGEMMIVVSPKKGNQSKTANNSIANNNSSNNKQSIPLSTPKPGDLPPIGKVVNNSKNSTTPSSNGGATSSISSSATSSSSNLANTSNSNKSSTKSAGLFSRWSSSKSTKSTSNSTTVVSSYPAKTSPSNKIETPTLTANPSNSTPGQAVVSSQKTTINPVMPGNGNMMMFSNSNYSTTPAAMPSFPPLSPGNMNFVMPVHSITVVDEDHFVAENAAKEQLLTTLSKAIRPSVREESAEELARRKDGKSEYVRNALLKAIQEDPAPSVRATCLRSLASLGIRDSIFQTALVSAQGDKDSTVRDEAKGIAKSMVDSQLRYP